MTGFGAFRNNTIFLLQSKLFLLKLSCLTFTSLSYFKFYPAFYFKPYVRSVLDQDQRSQGMIPYQMGKFNLNFLLT